MEMTVRRRVMVMACGMSHAAIVSGALHSHGRPNPACHNWLAFRVGVLASACQRASHPVPQLTTTSSRSRHRVAPPGASSRVWVGVSSFLRRFYYDNEASSCVLRTDHAGKWASSVGERTFDSGVHYFAVRVNSCSSGPINIAQLPGGSFLNPQPSTLNHPLPLTLNPQPSALNPEF